MKGPNLEFAIREWKRQFREDGGNTNSVEFKRAVEAFRRNPRRMIAQSQKANRG